MKKIIANLNCLMAVVAYVVVVAPIELFVMNTLIAFGYWVEECRATIMHGGRNIADFCRKAFFTEKILKKAV